MTPEILTGLSATAGFLFRMAANKQADLQQERLANSKQFAEVEASTAAARKHQGIFASITRTIMTIVLLSMLVFLLVAGMSVPTNLVIEIPAGSFLGVFSWSASTEIKTVTGLVAYPWLPKMVFIVIAFYFGQGSAKRV